MRQWNVMSQKCRRIMQDLHADLYDGWLRLYTTLDVKGLHTTLSVDLKLIQMEMNQDVQLMVLNRLAIIRSLKHRFKNICRNGDFILRFGIIKIS